MNKNMILLLTAFLLVFGVQLVKGNTQPKNLKVYYLSVEIDKGDTLWDIAKEYKQEGQATKSYVKQIMKTNNMLGSKIRAGDTLFVPVCKAVE